MRWDVLGIFLCPDLWRWNCVDSSTCCCYTWTEKQTNKRDKTSRRNFAMFRCGRFDHRGSPPHVTNYDLGRTPSAPFSWLAWTKARINVLRASSVWSAVKSLRVKTLVCLHLFGLSCTVKFIKKYEFISVTATYLLKGIWENPLSHCSVHKVVQMYIRLAWRCMHRASSYNMYINQQDAQNSCD